MSTVSNVVILGLKLSFKKQRDENVDFIRSGDLDNFRNNGCQPDCVYKRSYMPKRNVVVQ